MKFLIYLAVFFLLFNGFMANKEANSLIEKSCKKSVESAREPTNYFEICVASLKENPESQKVKNIDELTLVGTSNAISNVSNVKVIMEKIIEERKYKSSLGKTLLQDCIKAYSKAYLSLSSSLKYLKTRNYSKYLDGLRDAKRATVVCESKFKGDNKQISPVKKENDVVFVMIDIPFRFNYEAHQKSS